MGGKYEVRYIYYDADFSDYNTVFTNSFIKFVKLLFKHRKSLIYFKIMF